MIAVAATLLATTLAAAPARAQDSATAGPSATIVDQFPDGDDGAAGETAVQVDFGDTNASASGGQATSTTQSNSATNTQTTTTRGGDGGTATGGNSGPSQAVGDGSRSGSRGGSAYANGGHAVSHNSLTNEQSNQVFGRNRSRSGYEAGNRGGRSGFAPSRAARQTTGGSTVERQETRFADLFGLGAPIRGALEATRQFVHDAGTVSPSGGDRPGPGRVPDQNPFLNLLSAPGGANSGLMLLILLAVLTASFALPNRHARALSKAAAVWRPPAYLPPIELPG